MPKSICSLLIPILMALGVLVEAGCTRQMRVTRAIARADGRFATGQYDAAEIDYLNARQLDANNAHATAQLGIIYLEQGRVVQALPFLVRARDLAPADLETRIKLGEYLLTFGKFQQAREQANYVLDHDPRQPDAPLLLAEAADTPAEIEAARTRLGRLPAEIVGNAPVLTGLGTLEFRQRHSDSAESLFKRALAVDPKYGAADTGLALLYWQKKMLGEAGPAFAEAAELSPLHSNKRLQYVQFKMRTGDRAGARLLLEDLTKKVPDSLPAAMMLASLDEDDKRYSDGETLVANVLQRDPTYPDALLMEGRLRLQRGEKTEAIAGLQAALRLYPHSAEFQYELAEAYLAAGANDKAANSFSQAMALSPGFSSAVLALAQLKIQSGDSTGAILDLKQLIQRHPELDQARYLTATAYLAQKDFDEALAIYGQIAGANPKDPQPITLAGLVLMQQGRGDQARNSFEKARQMAPDYLPALEQLVSMDMVEKREEEARRRVDEQIARNPAQAESHLLLGRIFFVQHNLPSAEGEFKRAIQLQPDSPDAYYFLAQLYVDGKQDQTALADLRKVAAQNPKDTKALMLIGAIQDQEKDYPAAQDAYMKVLAVDPNFTPALNNLAYLESEYMGDIGKAFELAQRARTLLPNEAHTADTLGWILYKKREYTWALSLLDQSAAASPDSPEILFHLGMVQYMIGQEVPARATLQKALGLKKDFRGMELARECLDILSIDVATAGPRERATLAKAAAERPDDPGVLTRLAALDERDGATDEAITVTESILKVSPKDVTALTRLARLEAARGDAAKALGFARSAHALAPDDPDVAHLLGQLAFQTHDFPWSYSLLKDAAGKKPNDPEILFDFGQAAYRVGRVAEAQTNIQGALHLDPKFSRARAANRFLQLAAFSADDPPMGVDVDRIRRSAAEDLNDAPALMALGGIAEMSGDASGAESQYRKVLDVDPGFYPSMRHLVILDAEMKTSDPKANDWATGAREAYPDDPKVAKACGIIAYRRGDYSRAASLLAESSNRLDADGETLFYLGMSQYRQKDKSSRATLEKALGLGLKADLSAEARQAVATTK